MSDDIYERARAWHRSLGLVSLDKVFIYVVTEAAEMEEARETQENHWPTYRVEDRKATAGEIGDLAFNATVLYDMAIAQGFPRPISSNLFIEYSPCERINLVPDARTLLQTLRRLGDGLLKPKKADQVVQACLDLFTIARIAAETGGIDFEKECFLPTVEKAEKRAREGGKVVNGAFVRAEAQ